jgi:cytochrome c-type biogenesis protein CcmE
MAQATWEKPKIAKKNSSQKSNRLQFMIAGVVLLGAVAFLIISGTATGTRFFLTVDEIVSNPEYVGQTVRISGAVIGDTIEYDSRNLVLDFTIANLPNEYDDLATALRLAVIDPDATRISIHIENEVIPDLLQHEAQAIMTGEMGEDGIFYATELFLKCPSRFEEASPGQALQGGNS